MYVNILLSLTWSLIVQAILPEKSEVEYMIPKVEIRLTKADICSWPTLEIQKPKEAPQQSS